MRSDDVVKRVISPRMGEQECAMLASRYLCVSGPV